MRKTPLQMIIFLSLLTLAACGSTTTSSRPITPSPTQTPRSPNVYVSTAATVYALNGTNGKLLWNNQAPSNPDNAPVLNHGVAYVGAANALDALDMRDGKLLWSYPATGSTQVLGIINGLIYGNSFALNASDGSLRWKYQSSDRVGGGIVADGAIYTEASKDDCQCSAPHTYTLALNASDGSVLWKTPQGTDDFSPQLAANGLLYGLDYFPDGPVVNLLVRKASDGSVAWQFPKAPQSAEVTIIGLDGDMIYALSNDGNFNNFPDAPNIVYALKASDGSVIWHTQIADMTPTSPTLIDKVLYLGSRDGGVTALSAADGKLLWHAQGGQAGPPPSLGSTTITSVVHGVAYLTYPQGFAALSASDGSLRWQYQASGGLTISTVANGVVYASSSDDDLAHPEDNKIYALNASDGSLLWHYDAPAMFFPPTVG